MAELHLLRPWWLLALPVGLALAWLLLRRITGSGAWQDVVDAQLRPHVLTAPFSGRALRWQAGAALLTLIVATVALAGPAWERIAVPAYRDDDALVVVLDMSRTMDATDVEPTRLERAKLKLLELLDRRDTGQTALVVFSTHAYTVTPLSTDRRTITAMVNVLATDLMPTRGSVVASGLVKAGDLLRNAGVRSGHVLLISDSEPDTDALEQAAALQREGRTVSVMAVGTAQGAPIALPGGGFLSDQRGAVLVPRLNASALRSLADAGGGRFTMLTPDGRDLDAVLPAAHGASVLADRSDGDVRADIWLDHGPWLAVALLPLLLLAFRRGWVAVWLFALLLPMPRAEAFEWASLWQRPDQRGVAALEADDPVRAADLFDDPVWQGVALYRSADYAESAAALEAVDTAMAHYNRGNALARSGQLLDAIAAYDRVLALQPDHEDALFNRELLEQLLEENPELAGTGQDEDSQPDDDDGQNQADGQPSGAGDPQAGVDESGDDDGVGPTAADTETGESGSGTDSPDPREMADMQDLLAGDGDQEADEGEPLTAMAEDEWSDEQAAEQWLRRVPQDPGGLLRRKFELQYQRMNIDQDGNPILREHVREPW